jgi:hypothetical protein
MTRYVGIDLHKHLIVGHVVDAAGKKVDTFRYESVDPTTLDHIGGAIPFCGRATR